MRRLLFGLAAAASLALTPTASSSDATTAICRTFGPYCQQALRVAWCESRFNVYARSPYGHWGLFQFGPFARSRYGFAWNPWTQSRAAYAYFRASGYRWTAWSCKP